jgi:Caspase domain
VAITSSKQSDSCQMPQRQALVVGAIEYAGQELENAVNDATRVATALCARGFVITTVFNPTKAEIDATLVDFKQKTQKAELAMIYLAGHAVERHGCGYFLPVDFQFPLQPASLRYTAVSLNEFVEATEGAGSRIVVLDACRNWPQDPDEARRVSNDLDQLVADERDWPNLLLAYSTSAKKGAGDGAPGAGSAFANALCNHLLDHGLTVDECFRRVSQNVLSAGIRQQPWTYSSLALTISFTDLPRFSAIQRLAVPNPKLLGTGAWTVTDAGHRSVVVGVGDELAWIVDLQGLQKVHSPGEDRLMGVAAIGKLLLLAGSEGALYRAGAGSAPILDLEMQHSFGLSACPTGRGAVYYGAKEVCCLDVSSKTIRITARYNLGFGVYSCTYMPNGVVWVGGENGKICEIDPRDPSSPVRDIAQLKHHVNAMAVTSTGERVFVVGQFGLAVELDRSGREVAQILLGRGFKTAAGIRAQLLCVTDDETIHRFIFDPAELQESTRDDLNGHLGFPDYPACALAPNLPILAIATQESSVILLDTRDLQVIQELDVGSGNSSIVAGLHFLLDHELVVIGGRGEVTFFGA